MDPFQNEKPVGFFQSNTAKMIMVGMLTLVLLIPLQLVKGLISERAERQDEVISETTGKWGESVYFYGPVIKVPYKTYDEKVTVNEQTKVATTEKTATTQYAYFFPNALNNTSAVTTKVLKRSNYESVVFTSKMQFSGNYTAPDFSSQNIPSDAVQWDKATILIKTTNLKSIKDEVKISIGESAHAFQPVYSEKTDSLQSLETGFIDARQFFGKTSTPFKFNITYDGSRQIRIVPIGKTTTAKMASNWASPSFMGGYLPGDDKKISDKGFDANWKVLEINRPFAQQSFGVLPDLSQYAFGVDFIIPVNEYQQNERASKYGFLVVGLTFLVFFLIQSISKIKIHIFQYTMIGLALIMFYTLLISITEHSSFMSAYLIATAAVVLLISLYSKSIMKNAKFPTFIGLSLTALYGFIYVIIQLENYALLFGSIGLFLILSAVMYFSRKIDWN
ncbi:MAG: cell envelope integrity protein CreD [Flavobacterium sp.]|nr:MAG: cell envelope integrity protein CreD [Flavobacterium sp.]